MYIRKENIRILIGIIIFVLIFVGIGISSSISRMSEIDNLVNYESRYSSDVPLNFSSEVIDISSIGGVDVKVSDNKKIIGFSLPYKAEASFEIIKNKLNQNNWKCADNNSKNNTTFFKDNGEYQWLFLNCIDIGGSSSAVFTCN